MSLHERPRTDPGLASALAVLGLIATIVAVGLTLDRVQSQAKEETHAHLEGIGHVVEHQIEAYAERLYGLRAGFAHDPDLSREDFRLLVDIDALTQRTPGAEFVSFIRQEADGLRVDYLEPWDPDAPALGVDINNEPIRRQAAEIARSSGEVAVTRPLHLMQPAVGRGFLVMLAAYDVSPVPATAAARERHFLGVVAVVFTADKVLHESVHEPSHVPYWVYDAGPVNKPPRHEPRPGDWITSAPLADYTDHADIGVGSRRWRIVTTSPVPTQWTQPLAVAAIGLAVTALTAGSVAIAAFGRRRAVRLAALMTADLRASERHLREAKEEAERANDAKSEFLSRMSHELRTPLTAILGFTEMLEIADVPPEQQRMFISRTHKAGEHLLLLINDVLDISRVESGTLPMSIDPVAIRGLIDEVLALLWPSATSRRITIDNEIDARHVVLADPTRLRQILVNMVSNAIKYNRDDGSVTLRSTTDSENVLVTVTDTGRGISAEDIPRLFQPFERLGVHTGEVEGTGIGLALSRALAEEMGGSLTVTSESGHGSEFTLCLPRAESMPSRAGRRNGADGTDEPTATALYIDGNLANLVIMENALALRPDLQLVHADGGETGLSLARDRLPDLVLLDLDLPDAHADETLARLRADEATARIPVVAISTDTTPRRTAALIEAGAFALVTRPLVIRELLETVDEALASRDRRK